MIRPSRMAARASEWSSGRLKASRPDTPTDKPQPANSPPSAKAAGSGEADSYFCPVTKIEKTDPIWSLYVKETQIRDKEMLEAWNNNLDVLLVFAGLFSAILTAFLIELSKDLKADPADATHEYFRAFVQRLDFIAGNQTSPLTPFQPSTFQASPRSIRVNSCWFTSLTFSLMAAAGAMLAKQWLREYTRNSTTGSHHDQVHVRQERYDGLEKWKLREVVDLLPTLMYIALILFFIGLIDFLWGLHRPIGIITTILFLLGITFIVITTGFAIYFPSCPYRTPLIKHASPTHSAEAAKPDDLEPLLWILCESRYEETVRTSLKLISAVSGSPASRGRICGVGAITRICDLFDVNHPTYSRLKENDREAIAFGLTLRSLLTKPRPPLPEYLVLEDLLRSPLQYMSSHSNINLRILATSFLTLDVDKKDAMQGFDYSIMEAVTTRPLDVEPWARILLLNVLREWMGFIRTHAPMDRKLARRPENTPVAILNTVALVGSSAPAKQVDQELLASFLASMTVALGGTTLHGYPPSSSTTVRLGPGLVTIMDEMQRHKDANGKPAEHGTDHTDAVIPLSDLEPALVKLLSVVNLLLPSLPQMMDDSWPNFVARVIDFAYDSQDQEVVDSALQTILLTPYDASESIRSSQRIKRLLHMCFSRPCFSELPRIPDPYFLDILTLTERLLPSLSPNFACPFLLEEASTFAPSFIQGLNGGDTDVHAVILKILDFIFGSNSYTNIHGELGNELVKAGLVDALLLLIPRTSHGPRQSQVTRTIGWFGRSPNASHCLETEAVLDVLVGMMRSIHGQDYAARAIILLWDSAKRASAGAQQLGELTRRVIASQFLYELSGWFEKDTVGDGLYQSYQEIEDIWPGLFRDVLEVSPSALVTGSRVGPSRCGIVSAMLDHLARKHRDHGTPSTEKRAIERLGQKLGELEEAAKQEVAKIEALSSSTHFLQ